MKNMLLYSNKMVIYVYFAGAPAAGLFPFLNCIKKLYKFAYIASKFQAPNSGKSSALWVGQYVADAE